MNVLKLFPFAIAALMLVSCSDNKNMEKMIPADATCVVSINLPDLLTQARFDTEKGEIEIPKQLQDVIKSNPDSPIGRIVADLPVSGVNFENNVYFFMTRDTFRSVMLVSLDDDEKAINLIQHRTGAKFSKRNNIKFLHYQDYTFAIDGSVLLAGKENRVVSDEQLARAAAGILFKNAKSIRDVEDIKDVMDSEGDVIAYFNVQGFNSLLSSIPGYSDFVSRLPFLSIFTDSDIDAFTCSLKFQPNGADILANIRADEGADFIKLLDVTLSKPDNGFLKAMPNTMKLVMELSVKGSKFMELEQIKKTVNVFNNLPSMSQLNMGEIIATFDGPLAIGISPSYMLSDNGDNDFAGDYNMAIVARSSDPNFAVNSIKKFAAKMGQPDYVKDGRHVFNYHGRPVYVGTVGDYVYVTRLDHEFVEGTLDELPDLMDRFSKCALGVYTQSSAGSSTGFMSFGFQTKTEGNGLFYTAAETDSPALVLLELMCSMKERSHPDESDYVEEY